MERTFPRVSFRVRLQLQSTTGVTRMFTLKLGRFFSIEIENGIYLKFGRREMFWSRGMGLSID